MEFFAKQFSDLTTGELYEILKARCGVFVVEQSSSCRLFFPLGAVTVVVEDDTVVLFKQFFGVPLYGAFKVLRFHCLFQLFYRRSEGFRYDGVEDDVRVGNGRGRAEHTEFEFIARKRKGRSTVSVRRVDRENRAFGYADRAFHRFVRRIVFAKNNGIDKRAYFVAEVYREDGRGSFAAP